MSSVHAVAPPIPARPPHTPLSPTYVQLPPSTFASSSSSSSSSSRSSRHSSMSASIQSSPPPVLHANSYPSMTGRTFDYSDYSDVPEARIEPTFAPPQPARAASTSLPSRASQSHRPHHRPHGMSVEDRALALRLQREEESRVSEEAIRVGLTQQFAKAAGRSVDQVDLSALSLEEAQQAVEIQMKIKADKKKRGMLGGLKARWKLNSSKPRKNKSNTSPTASSSSGSHLSVGAGADSSGRRSPSPSPLPANVDVDAMSYDELLALSEAIGDVKSKGMSESEIERLPTAVWERKRAEGEPEEEPEPVEQAEEKAMEVGGEVSEQEKVKAKKKRGFFARIRGSNNKHKPPRLLPSPPTTPITRRRTTHTTVGRRRQG